MSAGLNIATDEEADEVFAIAKLLAQHGISNDSNIALRSAVSRGYYSVFLAAHRRSGSSDTNEVHGKVIGACKKNIGFMRTQPLIMMRELRVIADYFTSATPPSDMDAPHDLTDWQANWKYVEVQAPQLRVNLNKWKR